MKNSKLILLLKTYDVADWRRFGEFLATPFFNKKKELIPFYRYLKKIAPEFRDEKLDKTVLFQKIYPNQTFDQRLLGDIIHYLLRQAEHFLKIIRLENKTHTSNLLILEELLARKLEKNYRLYRKKAQGIIDHKKQKDESYYLFQYQLSKIDYQHFIAQKKRKRDASLQISLNQLDEFYFFNKLKSSCEILVNKEIIAEEDFELSFTEEVVNYLSQRMGKLSPIIKIYLIAYKLVSQKNADEHFLQLTELLDRYNEVMTSDEKNNLYLFAINYCVAQMKQNNQVNYYVTQCLALYMKGIYQKFLYQDGYLSPWTFKNVVKLGFNLKRFEWTENFIQEYHAHLEDQFQEDAYNYNLADLHYRKQNYSDALTHLMQVQFTDIFYNLGAKAMLIKIYYETDEEEALLSMIASFTIFLKRNKKIAPNFRQTYLNFVSLVYKILKMKAHNVLTIKETIATTNPLTDRRWLLKVHEEYGKKIR
ncbi:MAG: hypothetical protein AB8G86_27370 [Saprospiraceae bacterium]